MESLFEMSVFFSRPRFTTRLRSSTFCTELRVFFQLFLQFFFARIDLLSTTILQHTQRGPSQPMCPRTTQTSRSPKDPRASLGESLNVYILARIPLQLSQLTFINVCGCT